MDRLAPAVHRSVVVFDVEGFGSQARTNVHQWAVRRELYELLERTFRRSGVDWASCDREDRGDGALILVPPTISKVNLVDSLPAEMVGALEEHNRTHCPEEQIRLRMSVHAGEVLYDEHGVVGWAVNHAFRLVDARVLRRLLASAPCPLAVIASSWFFNEVISQSPAARSDAYRQVRVRNKETVAEAWIRLVHPEDFAHAS
jgi:class 3 adenylate cyclase